MIPLRFFRDKSHVYVNNPDGTTIKMSIAEFESMLNGEGGSDIPEHTSSNQGEVLSVDANGDLVWKTLPPAGGGLEYVGYLILDNKNTSNIANGAFRDCSVNNVKELYDEEGNTITTIPDFDIAIFVGFYAGDQTFNGTFKGYQSQIGPADAPLFQYAPTMRISNSTGNALTVADGTLSMEYCLYKLG